MLSSVLAHLVVGGSAGSVCVANSGVLVTIWVGTSASWLSVVSTVSTVSWSSLVLVMGETSANSGSGGVVRGTSVVVVVWCSKSTSSSTKLGVLLKVVLLGLASPEVALLGWA